MVGLDRGSSCYVRVIVFSFAASGEEGSNIPDLP